MSDILKSLPPGLVAYSRSPDFTPATLPAKLQSAHFTKSGVWALLHVLEGKVLYQLEPPHSGEQLVCPGEYAVIQSGVLHRASFVEPGRLYVEFYRAPRPDEAA